MDSEYKENPYKNLVGKKIINVVVESRTYPELFGLKFDDGTTAWILCDEEGNGPGFLDIVKK